MLRKSARVSGRLLVSAMISWSLIPIAVADAPTPTANPAAAAAESADAKFKRLHTVPEDGIGDDHWLSGATNFVRELLAKRPNEDLVICVAGCVPKQDRVVYAQPAEPTSRPSVAVSDAAPQPPAAPQADAGAAAENGAPKSEFVPTMAKPENAETPPTDGAVEAAPETVDVPSNDPVEPDGAVETPDASDLR